MRQLYFIEGRYLGESLRGPLQCDRDVWGWPLSKLFYCAECGEVFAKCPVESSPGVTTSWTAVFACCRKCAPKSGMLVPGSIWHHESEFVAAFPRAVLLWEVERLLDLMENER